MKETSNEYFGQRIKDFLFLFAIIAFFYFVASLIDAIGEPGLLVK